MGFKRQVIFATVGSTQFDALIKLLCAERTIEQIIDLGFKRLNIQYGSSDYPWDRRAELESRFGDRLQITEFAYKPSLADDLERADLVIGHAGAGTCLEALRANKRLLLVSNDSLMDDHQSELADELSARNYLVRSSCENFNESLQAICDPTLELARFPASEPGKFEAIFRGALEKAVNYGAS